MYFFLEAPLLTPPQGSTEHKALQEVLAHPLTEILDDSKGGKLVRIRGGYLRKANAVHGWIVREIAAGVDDCKPLELTRGDLSRLREACLQALERRPLEECTSNEETPELIRVSNLSEVVRIAREEYSEGLSLKNLDTSFASDDPRRPTVGPFFGSSKKDGGYYEDLQYTCAMIEGFLGLSEIVRIIYRASW